MNPRLGALVASFGLIGFIAGLAIGRGSTETPSPSSIAALPTTLTGKTSAIPAVSPTSEAPAAAPTATAPGAWVRTELPASPIDSLGVSGIWGIDSGVIALANAGDDWTLPYLDALAPNWIPTPSVRAVDTYMGGRVVDGRLWFVVRTSGFELSDVTWRLVGTSGGEEWKALAPTHGLGDDIGTEDENDRVALMDRIGGTWVAAVWLDGNVNDGITAQALRWSRDGVRWSDARVPTSPNDAEYYLGAAALDFMVVIAEGDRILTSANGVDWRRARTPTSLDGARSLACSSRACVLSGSGAGARPPVAWVSLDGRTWTASTTTLDDGEPTFSHITAVGDRFVAIQGETNVIWSSLDGRTWRSFDVIPLDLPAPIDGLAGGGGIVVAIEANTEAATVGAWRGFVDDLFGD